MLWRVRGSNLAILGSLHTSSRRLAFRPGVENALERAEVIAFEANLDVAPDMTSGRYSKTGRLSEVISLDLYRDAAVLWESLGLPLDDLEHFRPWAAAFTLMNNVSSRHGFDTRYGVDRQALNFGKARRKTLFFLEDVNAGFLPFKQAPLHEQENLLANAVRNTEENVRDLQTMVDAWEVSQPSQLVPIAEKGRLRTPTIFTAAISGRNRKWLPKLLKLAGSGKQVVAAVGALHVVAAVDSLPSLLGQHGYTCELDETVGAAGDA